MATDSDALADLRKQDPVERVAAAGRMIEEHRQAMAALGQVRAEAVTELRSAGMSLAEIAKLLNVTRQQIHRLEQSAESV